MKGGRVRIPHREVFFRYQIHTRKEFVNGWNVDLF
jgi:hypothetical protein